MARAISMCGRLEMVDGTLTPVLRMAMPAVSTLLQSALQTRMPDRLTTMSSVQVKWPSPSATTQLLFLQLMILGRHITR